MKVAAPPRQVEPFDVEPFRIDGSDRDDPTEALIKEARQRARRRRLLYGVFAVLVAIAAVVAVSIGSSSTSPPQDAAPDVGARSAVPLGEPLVVGPDDESTLLTSWGDMHVGYVFVYADGGVVWYPDGGVVFDADARVTGIRASPVQGPTDAWMTSAGPDHGVPAGEFGYAVIERRLSRRGLDLVRAGQLTPREFLGAGVVKVTTRGLDGRSTRISWQATPPAYPREDLWAEPTARLYVPSKYAICGSAPNALDPTRPVSLTFAPRAVQTVLSGKHHTYDPSIAFTNPGMDVFARTSDGGPVPMDCLEVTAAEEAALYQLLDANGSIQHDTLVARSPSSLSWRAGWTGEQINATPIYPHGQPVFFGG
jgi:hypothetical protein